MTNFDDLIKIRKRYENSDIDLLCASLQDIASDVDSDNIADHITEIKILVKILEDKINVTL